MGFNYGKIASVDYKIIIKGNASIPDGSISVRINDN